MRSSKNRKTRSKKSEKVLEKEENPVEERVMSKKGSTSGKGNGLKLIAEDVFNDYEVEVIDAVKNKKEQRV